MRETTHLVLKAGNGWRAGGCFNEGPQTAHLARKVESKAPKIAIDEVGNLNVR